MRVSDEIIRFVNQGGWLASDWPSYIRGADGLSLNQLAQELHDAEKKDRNLWIRSKENQLKGNAANDPSQ